MHGHGQFSTGGEVGGVPTGPSGVVVSPGVVPPTSPQFGHDSPLQKYRLIRYYNQKFNVQKNFFTTHFGTGGNC